VNALRNIDEALVTARLLIDTQPVCPHPPVKADGREPGTLDMSDWARTIEQIDGLTDETLRAGVFTIVDQRRFTVTDHFDTGADFVAEVREWDGTRIDPALAERIAGEQRPVRVHQEVRLRILQTRRH
jgi:hypothetical protein